MNDFKYKHYFSCVFACTPCARKICWHYKKKLIRKYNLQPKLWCHCCWHFFFFLFIHYLQLGRHPVAGVINEVFLLKKTNASFSKLLQRSICTMLGKGLRYCVAHDLCLEWVYISYFCITHLCGIQCLLTYDINSLLCNMPLTEQC